MSDALAPLLRLQEKVRSLEVPYWVPGRWIDQGVAPCKVDYGSFWSHWISKHILAIPPAPLLEGPQGSWSRQAVVYNLFVRTSLAFDHDQDGCIAANALPEGLRESGTLAKCVFLLPYLRSLGVNVVYLLPITAIGQDGNKGSLGSPYAIRNPYQLDSRLAEPALELGAEAEFQAFVAAAHHLGLRVVLEFVFRTAAKDADWVAEHPEWFYWIKAEVPDRLSGSHDPAAYGPPLFAPQELAQIKEKVAAGERRELPPPPAAYRALFTPVPQQVRQENGRYIGCLADGTRVRVAGAFADWPPDDNQPPWTDVTYLRLYDHPHFNYIAYNTVRMYDQELARPENALMPLWEHIWGILPHYISNFDIDGVMIDMGHALPWELKKELIARARQAKPDFAFWDENFKIEAVSRDQGYNAVLGYAWCDCHPREKLRALLQRLASAGVPLPFFATPETHNTPRAAARPGGRAFARYAMAVLAFLPAMPVIHGGAELAETAPINTGLDFTDSEIARWPADQLPLFSQGHYDWLRDAALIDWIRRVLQLRARYAALINDPDPASFHLLTPEQEHTLAFVRGNLQQGTALLVVANMDYQQDRDSQLKLARDIRPLDLLSGTSLQSAGNTLQMRLAPGQVVVCELV